MVDNLILTVKDVVEDGNELVVAFGNQNTILVYNDTGEEPSPGATVRLDENQINAVEVIQPDGSNSGNLVGVVKRISSERIIVQTENTHLSVLCPDELNLNVDDTVEMDSTSGRILGRIDDIDPPTFASSNESSDLSRYRTESPDNSFDDIGGLEIIKERVKEVVELPLSKGDEFSEIGADPPTGVLFHGPPGTGKTLFARAVADSLEDGTFYNINGPEVLSKWYGESEREIRRIFEDASQRNGPSIIFIDEIESIASSREGSREVNRRIVTQLLTVMDGFDEFEDVIVIAATNRPGDIDQALRRPGRFDREVEFPSKLPIEDRVDILKTVSKQEEMNIADSVDFTGIAEETEGWTGAELKRLLNDAAVSGVKDNRTTIIPEDLALALKRIERSRRGKQNESGGDKDNA
jgi:transitional endoplasmic reticulum ATPase